MEINSPAILEYYWGKDWSGEYPKWERITPEQRRELGELNAMVEAEMARRCEKNESICGCPMCEYHVTAYIIGKSRETQANPE